MQSEIQIPYYAPDGSSLGFRSLQAAMRLIEGGYVPVITRGVFLQVVKDCLVP